MLIGARLDLKYQSIQNCQLRFQEGILEKYKKQCICLLTPHQLSKSSQGLRFDLIECMLKGHLSIGSFQKGKRSLNWAGLGKVLLNLWQIIMKQGRDWNYQGKGKMKVDLILLPYYYYQNGWDYINPYWISRGLDRGKSMGTIYKGTWYWARLESDKGTERELKSIVSWN